MSKNKQSTAGASKKTRSSTSSLPSGKQKSKPSASAAKGRKTRDRAELEKMNGLESVGELHGQLGVKNKDSQKSKTPSKILHTGRQTTNELADSLAKAL